MNVILLSNFAKTRPVACVQGIAYVPPLLGVVQVRAD